MFYLEFDSYSHWKAALHIRLVVVGHLRKQHVCPFYAHVLRLTSVGTICIQIINSVFRSISVFFASQQN